MNRTNVRRRTVAALGSVTAAIAVATGCSTSGVPSGDVPPITPITLTPSSTAVTVDPSAYETRPGVIEWVRRTNPTQVCAIYADPAQGGPGVQCDIQFPPGTAPVASAYGTQVPNAVRLDARGVEQIAGEAGPSTPRSLSAGSTISAAGITCQALDAGGVDCQQGANGFRFDTKLTVRGTAITPTATTTSAPPVSDGRGNDPLQGSDGPYTEPTTPVAPGTMCGAATGLKLVTVVSGSISCVGARAVIEGYLALPPGDFGNANIRQYQGWQCSSPTYATARDLGYDSHCIKGEVEVRTPFSG